MAEQVLHREKHEGGGLEGRKGYEEAGLCEDLTRGKKNQRKLFLYKVFQQPFGSWTSAPKIVDVRTKKCVFLQPRWWGETF